jgi:hypothetical protein
LPDLCVVRYTGFAGFVWLVRQLGNVKRKLLKDIYGIVLLISPEKKCRSQRPAGGGLDHQEDAGRSLDAALGERNIVRAQTETFAHVASITADHLEFAVPQPRASRKCRLQGATLGFGKDEPLGAPVPSERFEVLDFDHASLASRRAQQEAADLHALRRNRVERAPDLPTQVRDNCPTQVYDLRRKFGSGQSISLRVN